jgi:hypothetical protein
MTDRSVIQTIADEAVSFFEWIETVFGSRLAREAIIKDLGGNPASAGGADLPVDGGAGGGQSVFPQDTFDSIRSFRDAENPDAEATIEAFANIAALLDVVATQIEAWHLPVSGQLEDLADNLLALLASNYVRVRWPRLFMLFQAVSLLDEIGSTYGEGSNAGVRLKYVVKALFGYIFDPGKAIEDIVGASGTDDAAFGTDLGARIAAGVAGWFVSGEAEDGKHFVVRDVYTGWDSPNLSIDSKIAPSLADAVSARLTSFALGWDSSDNPAPGDDGTAQSRVLVTLGAIPEALGGYSLFLALGGVLDVEQAYGTRWKFDAKFEADAAVALQIGGSPGFRIIPPSTGSAFKASMGLTSIPDASTGVSFSPKLLFGTRFEIGQLGLGLTLDNDAAELLLTINNGALVIDPHDQDPFVASCAQQSRFRVPFNLVFGYSSARGLVLEGSASGSTSPVGSGAPAASVIDLTVPLGKSIGPVTLHNVALRVTKGPADAAPQDQTQTTFEVDTSFSLNAGPFYLRLDQVGLAVRADGSTPPAERNLRYVDLHADPKGPRGVAIEINTSGVTGGGTITHDPDLGLYFGVIDLAFRGSFSLTAIGLIATKDAEGADAFSMIVLVTAEFSYPLGDNFYLEGFGGLLAMHRTFDEAAMVAALPTGQLRNVLFPSDPIRHSAEVLKSLQTLFPARHGSYLAGFLAKIGWNRPALIEFELGLIAEWGKQDRLILLGRVHADLPTQQNQIITFNMDAVGVLDFDAGTFALDARLYDSKLCNRFVLTGAMAMRMGFGESFALAIGGLHPRFTPPAGFPQVDRLQIALTNGDNPKLVCQAYFAVTSNTVQFGADISLYAAAYGFAIVGDAGFDVLIRLLPFHFLAEIHASVQLKHGSHNLFKISLDGSLEGPLPLRISAKASFEILWCDFSIPINLTLVEGDALDALVPVDALRELLDALVQPTSWQAQLPDANGQVVVTSQAVSESIMLHPLGTLRVRQTVVPLNLTRDIDLVGTGTPSGDRRFAVTGAMLGNTGYATNSVKELFAPAQFFEMTDDEKLAAPSFESMDAGVQFGASEYTIDFAAHTASPFHYTDVVIGSDGVPVTQPQPHKELGLRVLNLTLVSASATARTRTTLDRRFAAAVRPAAPTMRAPSWAAVAGDVDTAVGGATVTSTWTEARGLLLGQADRAGWFVAPHAEVSTS